MRSLSVTDGGLRPESGPAFRWADLLDGAPAVLEVPSDHPRPRDLVAVTNAERMLLGDGPGIAIGRCADAAGVSADDVLVCLWAALMARYTEQSDIVIGDLSGGPNAVRLVRLQVARETSFTNLLRQRSLQHADLGETAATSIDDLLLVLGAEPSTAKHPCFQIGFAVGDGRSGLPTAGVTTGADPHVPCDLVLRVHRHDTATTLSIDYPPTLFTAERIGRMHAHLVRLAEGATAHPDAPLGRTVLVGGTELALIDSWNATDGPLNDACTIDDLVAAQTATTPDAVAVEFEGNALTYGELDAAAEALAVRLRGHGVGPDVRVAVCIERSLEMIVALLGVLKAGGAYVPVDPSYPQARRDYIIDDARAIAILRRDAAEGISIEPQTAAEVAIAAGNGHAGARLAYVIYTSGSTGQPKGVAVEHTAAVNLLRWQMARRDFVAGARTLQFTSLSFDVSVQEIFSTLSSGGTLVVVRDEIRRNPLTLLEALIQYDVARIFLPFVALRGLANAGCTTARFPNALREVYTAGEQLQVDDTVRGFFQALPEASLENQYGPTEAAVIVTAHTLPASADTWESLPPIGRPIANVRIYILDPSFAPQPIGVPGDLYIAGRCLAREYLGKPELTSERFIHLDRGDGLSERVYRSGDLARWRADGSIEFLGRADNQVKFRGYRIEPGEVGAALSNHPDVEQCMATIRQVEGSGPRLVAYVKPRAHTLNLEALHRFARTVLPEHMVPSHVAVIDEFPLTPSGKIDIQALPTPAFNREILGVGFKQPRSVTEIRLSAIWSRLLGVERPGVDDDFFALGGDSLMAVEMFAQIRSEFNRELPLGALAAAPTVAQLAAKLDAAGDNDWSVVVPLQTRGAKTPLFCVHGGSGNVATFPLLARALPEDQPFYALQWDGLSGRPGTRTINAMAERYVAEVRGVQPAGPYLLAGQCIGGLISQQMARILLDKGEQVDLLVMYDSPNMHSPDHLGESPAERLAEAVREPAKKQRARNAFGMARRHLKVKIQGRVTPDFRHLYAVDVLCKATGRHRATVPPVPTLLFSTGETNASLIGLKGRWIDDALGWSSFASPLFHIHFIEGGHTEIMYSPEATAIVRDALDAAHAKRVGSISVAAEDR